ncbi:MAG: hypothetical protein K0R06_1440 [Clostridium sp.]|jgi:hypothetical protein|nr:hypothetical protein [Clostridium sp.]
MKMAQKNLIIIPLIKKSVDVSKILFYTFLFPIIKIKLSGNLMISP